MYVELPEAARLVGVSRSALNKKLEKGALSVSRDRLGKCAVDTAELQKVFGPLKPLHPSPRFKCLCPICLCVRQTHQTTPQIPGHSTDKTFAESTANRLRMQKFLQ